MRNRLLTLVLAVFSLTLVACGSDADTDVTDQQSYKDGKADNFRDAGDTEIKTWDLDQLADEGFREDPEIIRDVRVEGNELLIDVAFGGGCEEHEFRLHTDGIWLESLPPQLGVTLYHNSNNDFCEAFLSETLVFDLASLGTNEEIVLHIGGTEFSVNYVPAAPKAKALFAGDTEELEGFREDNQAIQGARVEGETLFLDVAYGGGCEEHQFELAWNGLVLESFPPQVNLELFHNSNNDFCEAFLSETLEFDISELGGGELFINFPGSDVRVQLTEQSGGQTLYTDDPDQLTEAGYRDASSEITNARLEGNLLMIDVSYGGGCEEHEFELHWDGTILESLPAQTGLTLYHNSNNDFCEAFLSDTLVFDVSELGTEIILHLSGSDASLRL